MEFGQQLEELASVSNTQSSPVVTKGKAEYSGLDAGRCMDAPWECVEVLYNGFHFFNEIRKPLIKNKCEIVDLESMRGKVSMK